MLTRQVSQCWQQLVFKNRCTLAWASPLLSFGLSIANSAEALNLSPNWDTPFNTKTVFLHSTVLQTSKSDEASQIWT